MKSRRNGPQLSTRHDDDDDDGRITVLGLGFCVRVRVRVSITGSVNYLNENCSLHTLLLSAPAIHRQSSQLK